MSANLRQRHSALFQEHGWPDQKLEDWRYVPLRGLGNLEVDEEPLALRGEDLANLVEPAARLRLVFIDGRFQAQLSVIDELPKGLSIRVEDDPQTGPFSRTEYSDRSQSPAAAALAGAPGIVSVEVASGQRVDEPLEILHLVSERTALGHSAMQVTLGERGELEVLEQFVAAGSPEGLMNEVVRVEMAADSRLTWMRLQRSGDSGHLITRLDVDQHDRAEFIYRGFDVGGRIVRHDIACRLLGREAIARLDGVFALGGARLVDNHTRVDHVSPHARSVEYFKGVVGGRSRGIFNGKIVVHKGAAGTDSRQTNRNLVLSERAEVDTKPELEIYADDVKCAHGATVGQLDESQLFYLQSRGLSRGAARRMLIGAFCQEMVDRVKNDALREYVGAVASEAMNAMIEEVE